MMAAGLRNHAEGSLVPRRISRRAALAAGLSTAAGLAAGAAPVPKNDSKSWVGKTVLPRKPDPIGVFDPPVDPERGPDRAALSGASWDVKAEKDGRVLLIGTTCPCWVEKELLVPLDDAIAFYTAALKADEKDVYAYNFRGWAHYLLGKSDAAVKDYDELLKLHPAPTDGGPPSALRQLGLSNRGLVLAEAGKFDAALKSLDEAVEAGHIPATLNRGWAHELKGDYKKALADYTTAGNYKSPADAYTGGLLATNNRAWLWSTCPDAKMRDGKYAVSCAEMVCNATSNREGMFLDTLAAAHAEAGDFKAAVTAQEKALEDAGYARKYGADAQKRLQLYKDKKPYRSEPLKPAKP